MSGPIFQGLWFHNELLDYDYYRADLDDPILCKDPKPVPQKIIKFFHTPNNRFEVDVKYNSIVY